METVVDRIERVMNERGWSARELARRAGLKPESQLSGILARLRGDPDAVELRTLKKIAAGAEVPWEWLLTGREDLVEEALRSKRFRDLAGWPGLLEAARALAPAIPEWVWQVVADSPQAEGVEDAEPPEDEFHELPRGDNDEQGEREHAQDAERPHGEQDVRRHGLPPR